MNRENLFILLLFISLLVESAFVSLPFVFLVSLLSYIFYPGARTIIVTAVFGVLADVINVTVIGQTSLAILIAYLFVELYKKAFDTSDWRILLAMLFVATFTYANIFLYENNLLIYLSLFAGAGIVIHYFTREKILW